MSQSIPKSEIKKLLDDKEKEAEVLLSRQPPEETESITEFRIDMAKISSQITLLQYLYNTHYITSKEAG